MASVVDRYRLGPFLLGSEVSFPELTALSPDAAGEPNAWIRSGRTPEVIDDVVANETRWWASRSEYLQRVPHVGSFHVKEGREIVVEPAPGAPPGDIRAYLLAPIFAQLCFQTGRYAIHGSSVRVGDRVVAFPADSGAGKSTLAAGLERRGFPTVSDDMCLLDASPGNPRDLRVVPVAPALKLWPTALAHLGTSPVGLPKVWSREEKFRMRVHAPDECLPLRQVIFLDWDDDVDAAPTLSPMQGAEALARLMRLMHFDYLMKAVGRQAECFQVCGQILRQAPSLLLRRPRNFAHMERVLDLVEEHVRTP